MSMRVLAYSTKQGYAAELARAFVSGCRRHGVKAEARWCEEFQQPEDCDVIWLYGLIAMARIFDAYQHRALCVTGDLGYWRAKASELPISARPVRIAINAQQPDAHLRLRPHTPDRFHALHLNVETVQTRGQHVLLTGQCEEQARFTGYQYGEWEARTAARLGRCTTRPIVVREKPNSARLDLPGTTRCEDVYIDEAIRKSWAVVCHSGNVGADCILHGVPVFAQRGPGSVYGNSALEQIDSARPLDAYRRISALADLSHWQWSLDEFAAGDLWAHLEEEIFCGQSASFAISRTIGGKHFWMV